MPSTAIYFDEQPGNGGNLGLVTLNRPEALNALTHEMIFHLHQQLLEWENNSAIKAVVIRAAEGRAFCAGGDLRLVYEKHKVKDPTLPQFFKDEYRLNHYIFHYSKPYISFLDGITMGGGAGISLNGSHCVGTERLLFAMPETGIGFFPDVGSTYFLSRLPKALGFYLGLTGAKISCDDCLDISLIRYKIKSSQLNQVLVALADNPFKHHDKEVVTTILQGFHQRGEPSALSEHYPFISQQFSNYHIEDLFSALDAHKNSLWHQETAVSLRTKSPTSLKVTLKQLHEGLKRNFDQCLQLEYHLMCHFIQGHDFFEGIRALLIEKTQNPQWRPSKLSELSQEDIDNFFLPSSNESAQLLFT